MYLSAQQHDQLQILVTGFEIPYRTYIAQELLIAFPAEQAFLNALSACSSIHNGNSSYQVVNTDLRKLKSKGSDVYRTLEDIKQAKQNGAVPVEINVPVVSQLISLTVIFGTTFSALLNEFRDEETYLKQALRYKYVRNKLDHRGSKTLETQDMMICLEFIANSLRCLEYDTSLFWEKDFEAISRELVALQTSVRDIPVSIINIQDMPFPDAKIICRDSEIKEIKEYVYGMPNALRKQSSFVLFGYGGVGKTALVLEAVKQIVQDLMDNTTVNGYHPDFILFFTAKEESLDFSRTSGKLFTLPNRPNHCSFKTADELKRNIFSNLNISSFSPDYDQCGLIIIDNLETLSENDRKQVAEFVRSYSPPKIQYIITSRNEEHYERSKHIAGFESDESGREFVRRYMEDNNYNFELNDDDITTLLRISRGNTLVLVLCLRRLSLNVMGIEGIMSDMTEKPTVAKLQKELDTVPPNGFNIVSEFMFKNSFEELRRNYQKYQILSDVLTIFAVPEIEAVDLYTIQLISKHSYDEVDLILALLCRYLILEKTGESYRLNQFAKKYIIQLFLPDDITYKQIADKISSSYRSIQDDLKRLQSDLEQNHALKRIIQDWHAVSDGDRIAIAKAYRLYGDVQRSCRTESEYYVDGALNDFIQDINELERTTMHPYVKYQKARILQMIHESRIINQSLSDEILAAYDSAIWTIRNNSLYFSILRTKSYAAILWLYAMQILKDPHADLTKAVRYLEESKSSFEQLSNTSNEYYQCLVLLGETCLKIYRSDMRNNLLYLRKARSISRLLYADRQAYAEDSHLKWSATQLGQDVRRHGSY